MSFGHRKEKNIGEIGNEGIETCPNGPLASKGGGGGEHRLTRRSTVVQLTFSGRTAYPYKVCHCFIIHCVEEFPKRVGIGGLGGVGNPRQKVSIA